MDAVILNTSFEPVYLLDAYESFIWTDRFCGYGDFEIYTPLTSDLLEACKIDYYVYNAESEHLMIIEEIEIKSDAEEGTKLIISGRSAESLLLRRIVWRQTTFNNVRVHAAIKKLINDNISSSAPDNNRRISNFVFEDSTDTKVTSLMIGAQFTGDNLYDSIVAMCDAYGLGFKVILNDSNEFVFSLYAGTDRSYDNTENNSYVIFSPTFENFVNSNYLENKQNLKTIALIAGEGEGLERVTTTTTNPKDSTKTGINRREMYVDARDIRSLYEDENGYQQQLTTSEYIKLLRERGEEKISEFNVVSTFEGEVDFQQTFVYGEDFFLGDIVQLQNEFGVESVGRIQEIVFSQDNEGYKIVPSFGST